MIYQPWDDEKRRQLHAQAVGITRHSTHHPGGTAAQVKLARDNCGACALRTMTQQDAPNYAGWLRIYIQLGWPVLKQHYDSELRYAEAENPQYYAAIQRDIATFGDVKIAATLGELAR
jgi:hypothetical protein